MKKLKVLRTMALLIATVALVPLANAAPTVHVLGAGSSALFNPLALAAVNDVDPGATPHHFSIKGACATTTCAQLEDTRLSGIPIESANLWVAYVCSAYPCTGSNATDVWAYLQVDSSVGDRTFLARLADGAGATAVLLDSCMDTSKKNVTCQSQNLVSGSTLFRFGVPVAQSGAGCTSAMNACDDQFLPTDVFDALTASTQKLNMAGTDIRAEDALYATHRANQAFGVGDGLGYSTSPNANFGATIQSAFSSTGATPVNFGLPGTNDPITGGKVPSTIKTIRVGESSVIVITNRTNAAGLGAPGKSTPFFYTNITDNASHFPANSPAGNLFGGNENCDGLTPALGGSLPAGVSDFPLHVLLREPLSGTMNTSEFSIFRIYGGTPGAGTSVGDSPNSPLTTQEFDTGNPSAGAPNNPLKSKPCNGSGAVKGDRSRAIGTGEMVSEVLAVGDGIGYTFFSFGNVSKIGGNPKYGYLTLDGVDGLFNKYAGGDPGQPGHGELPTCTPGTNCQVKKIWTSGNSFPHLRDGTYRGWSALRVLCDTADTNCTDAKLGVTAVIAKAQDDIHNNVSVPDFLPFSQDKSFGGATGDGDINFIRSHYAFKDTAFENPNKYAKSHGFESFILPGAGGLPNNLASDAGPETGGDAGGCIIPIGQAGTACHLSKAKPGAVNGVAKFVLAAACSGPAPAKGETLTAIGFSTLAYDGVFVVTAVSGNAAGSKITVTDKDVTTGTAVDTQAAFGTLSVGCSQ